MELFMLAFLSQFNIFYVFYFCLRQFEYWEDMWDCREMLFLCCTAVPQQQKEKQPRDSWAPGLSSALLGCVHYVFDEFKENLVI